MQSHFTLGLFLALALSFHVCGQEPAVTTDVTTESGSQKEFDPAKLVGTWKYVRGEKNGTALESDHFAGQVVEITKETIALKSEEFVFEFKYELVADSKPQAVTLTITKSPFGTGQETSGIIQVEGDTIKLCYLPMGGEAPTKFEAKADSGHHFFELKRESTKPVAEIPATE